MFGMPGVITHLIFRQQSSARELADLIVALVRWRLWRNGSTRGLVCRNYGSSGNNRQQFAEDGGNREQATNFRLGTLLANPPRCLLRRRLPLGSRTD